MKRGLKVTNFRTMRRIRLVTFLAPMKRGLKVDYLYINNPFRYDGNIPCPDEKGTESSLVKHIRGKPLPVTFLAPMKRGLKVHWYVFTLAQFRSNIPCPDEKGTERDGVRDFRHVLAT